MVKDLVRKAYDDPPIELRKSQPNTSKNADHKGTYYNQFFATNPERQPALADPKGLNDQLQNLETKYNIKTKSMINLIDKNVEAKQREDHRRAIAEQKRR